MDCVEIRALGRHVATQLLRLARAGRMPDEMQFAHAPARLRCSVATFGGSASSTRAASSTSPLRPSASARSNPRRGILRVSASSCRSSVTAPAASPALQARLRLLAQPFRGARHVLVEQRFAGAATAARRRSHRPAARRERCVRRDAADAELGRDGRLFVGVHARDDADGRRRCAPAPRESGRERGRVRTTTPRNRPPRRRCASARGHRSRTAAAFVSKTMACGAGLTFMSRQYTERMQPSALTFQLRPRLLPRRRPCLAR